LLFGLLVSLSSTAIVLNLLHRGRELLSPQGSLSVAVLLFQDLFAVPLLLALPLFSSNWISDTTLLLGLAASLFKAGLLLVVVILGSRYFVPLILKFVTGTGVRELFLITIALLAFGSAWLGAQIGLSVVFGAFLAGMLVSETQYGHQVVADLVPLREPFVALFFVSVGMLLDLSHFLQHWPIILALAAAVIVLKALVASAAGLIWRYDLRVSSLMGLSLAQIGEFSFVLAQSALAIGLLSAGDYQHFLSITVVTMLVSPSLALMAPQVSSFFVGRFKSSRFSHSQAFSQAETLKDHVVVIGLGVIGRSLARLLIRNRIGFVGIETDPRLFHELDDRHLSVIFGDGARTEILEAARIRDARLVIVSINDPSWTTNIVARIRHLRPDIHIIVRCQHFKDMQKLTMLKVDEFVVAEAQMAIEFSARVLKHFGIGQEALTTTIEEIEAKNDDALRQS
jgi:CPA2 family monovalent cation:H+ antiporter-2